MARTLEMTATDELIRCRLTEARFSELNQETLDTSQLPFAELEYSSAVAALAAHMLDRASYDLSIEMPRLRVNTVEDGAGARQVHDHLVENELIVLAAQAGRLVLEVVEALPDDESAEPVQTLEYFLDRDDLGGSTPVF